jgi:hypothetical protein
MLAKCLEALSNARSRPEVHIYADSVDETRLQEIEVVRDRFLPEAFLFHARPHIPAISGSWNILNSIKDAAKWAENVYLVEEDVLVYPNFFEYHESQDADVVCGRLDPRTRNRTNFYTNPGSYLRRSLLDALLPHINDEYYRDQREYCERNLPGDYGYLDDGLIRRVIDKHQLKVQIAAPAVCAHIGFRLYNHAAPYINDGITLTDRIAKLQSILAQVESLPVRHLYRDSYESFLPPA